jgi:hypothetical protein
MVSKQKRKGADFERYVVEYLNDHLLDGEFKKVPGSGALGTQLKESILTSDINGSIKGFPGRLKIECKKGYNTSKISQSFAVQRAWMNKVAEEAASDYRLPFLAGQFDNVHSGVRTLIVMDIDVFIKLANHITTLEKELENGN